MLLHTLRPRSPFSSRKVLNPHQRLLHVAADINADTSVISYKKIKKDQLVFSLEETIHIYNVPNTLNTDGIVMRRGPPTHGLEVVSAVVDGG